MSALCRVLIIYIFLSIRALVEVKHTIRIIKHRIVVYSFLKHLTTFIFNLSLSVRIVCRQLLVSNNIYSIEYHVVNSTNAEVHYG